jgi:hypothetical protein
MKRFSSMFAVSALAASMIACGGGTKLMVRPDATPPNVKADKFLIMPVDIHGLPGDHTAQEAALFGGFVGAFGEQGVPLQPIKPVLETVGLNNLSYEMAEGMYHLVSTHNTYDFNEDGGFHGGDSKLKLIVEGSAKLVETAAAELKLDFKPKYVVVAHIDSTGSSIPKTVGYRVIGGLYNVEAGKIDQVIWYETSTADDEKAILADMGTLGGKLYGLLFAEGEAAKK